MIFLDFSSTFNDELMHKIKEDLKKDIIEKCKQNIVDNESIDTGNMYDSIDGIIDENEVVVGSDVDYSLWVQVGRYRKPWLVTKEQVIESLQKVFSKYQ